MDLSKLTTGEKVIAGAGILFVISMFLPWWGLDFGEFGSASNNGFDYFLTGWLPLLIIGAMVAQIAVARFSTTQMPKIPIPWNQAHLIAGGVVAVLLILRVIIGSSEGSGGFEVDLDRMWGLWVALLAAVGVGVGGFLKSKEPEVEPVGGITYGGPGAPPPPGGYNPPPPGGGTPPPPPGGQAF
jgi:peptidoglycan/LPS O-acetylase OafA/YrhL